MQIIPSPVEFDAEHMAALEAKLAEYNQQTGQNLAAPEYLAKLIMGIFDDAKKRAIERSGQDLIRLAKELSDQDRVEFTARVRQMLAEYLPSGS